MHWTPFALVLCGFALAGMARAEHEEERSGRGRGARITFYSDANFRGGSFTLEAGEENQNLALERFSNGERANDRISSIRIDGPAEVTVYRDARFRGGSLRLTEDVRNLAENGGTWNDLVSSIRTEQRRRGDARAERAQIERAIESAYREILQRKPDPSELRAYRARMMEEAWSEKNVRDELKRSGEYKTVVERIVAKAYQDILGRKADAGGARNYAEHMLRDGWTEQDVRKSLRESEEYRDRTSASAER